MNAQLALDIEKYYDYKTSYYLGEPKISDSEFDKFEESLIAQGFDPKIGFDDIEDSDKILHRHKMLSLKKKQVLANDGNLTLELATEIFNTYGPGSLSWKYDGMAGEAQYTKGKITNIVSRGNGDLGRNLFPKLKSLLPQELNSDLTVDIRFEICMNQSTFDNKYSKDSGNKYSHARNLVAGIVRDENENDIRKNDLRFRIIEAITSDGSLLPIFENENIHQFYSDNVVEKYTCDSVEELIENFNSSVSYRNEFDYPTDGMVYKSNSASTYEHDGKYPDFATSIKFLAPKLISKVKDIKWKLQKTGKYIPSIHIDTLIVDGRKISKASGHNIEYLIKNDIKIGSTVELIIANDIIPMIKKLS